MNQRELFQSYMELAQSGFQRRDLRRNFEWKMSFGLWTAFAVMISFGAAGKSLSPDWVNPELFWGSHAVILILYLIWTAGLQIASRIDADFGFFYEHKAESMADPAGVKYDHLKPIKSGRWLYRRAYGFLLPRKWCSVSQIGITLTLLLLSIAVFERNSMNASDATRLDTTPRTSASQVFNITVGNEIEGVNQPSIEDTIGSD